MVIDVDRHQCQEAKVSPAGSHRRKEPPVIDRRLPRRGNCTREGRGRRCERSDQRTVGRCRGRGQFASRNPSSLSWQTLPCNPSRSAPLSATKLTSRIGRAVRAVEVSFWSWNVTVGLLPVSRTPSLGVWTEASRTAQNTAMGFRQIARSSEPIGQLGQSGTSSKCGLAGSIRQKLNSFDDRYSRRPRP
jgi:hypothetical protein